MTKNNSINVTRTNAAVISYSIALTERIIKETGKIGVLVAQPTIEGVNMADERPADVDLQHYRKNELVGMMAGFCEGHRRYQFPVINGKPNGDVQLYKDMPRFGDGHVGYIHTNALDALGVLVVNLGENRVVIDPQTAMIGNKGYAIDGALPMGWWKLVARNYTVDRIELMCADTALQSTTEAEQELAYRCAYHNGVRRATYGIAHAFKVWDYARVSDGRVEDGLRRQAQAIMKHSSLTDEEFAALKSERASSAVEDKKNKFVARAIRAEVTEAVKAENPEKEFTQAEMNQAINEKVEDSLVLIVDGHKNKFSTLLEKANKAIENGTQFVLYPYSGGRLVAKHKNGIVPALASRVFLAAMATRGFDFKTAVK